MAKYDNPGLLNEPGADPSVYPVFHGITTHELEKMERNEPEKEEETNG